MRTMLALVALGLTNAACLEIAHPLSCTSDFQIRCGNMNTCCEAPSDCDIRALRMEDDGDFYTNETTATNETYPSGVQSGQDPGPRDLTFWMVLVLMLGIPGFLALAVYCSWLHQSRYASVSQPPALGEAV